MFLCGCVLLRFQHNKQVLFSDDFSSFCFVVEFMTENNGQCKHQEVSHFVTSTNKFRAVGEASSAEDANHSHSHFPSPLKLNNHMVTLGFLYTPVSRFIDENLFLLLPILLQLPFLSHTPQAWKLFIASPYLQTLVRSSVWCIKCAQSLLQSLKSL